MVAIIAALVGLALVVVFIGGEPELRDPSTPEGVVQRYSAAVIAEDEDQAKRYLTDREGCGEVGLYDDADLRVTLVSTTERDDSAEVRVAITSSYSDGGFGGSSYTEEAVFELTMFGDEWKIETAPWQLAVCEQPGR